MLVMGVCNPEGEKDEYNGLYFTDTELRDLEGGLNSIPVKAEHKGDQLGEIVSSFVDEEGRLQCLMRLNDSVEGAIAQGLVKNGIVSELSLGYSVDLEHSDNGNKLQARKKTVMEVSLVRKGARDRCYVLAFEGDNGVVFPRDKSSLRRVEKVEQMDQVDQVDNASAWSFFNLQ